MILTETRNNVMTGGIDSTSQFRIKASKKAFEILSSGLYSDKIRAIIRELSTNAADAHVAAGKAEVPFKVHLPNNLEPWFAVEDYGTGLSEERMMTLYTTYFDSDKTDSNDFTGALGLGSKSPFSYTDQFTVESRFQGVKSVYTAYLGENGCPGIVKLTSEPTDEPNGLTVRFPINRSDFGAFQEKAAATLCWFKVHPTIVGAKITLQKTEYLIKTANCGVHKTRTTRSYVVMGNIAYPLDPYSFLDKYDPETTRLRKLVEWGVEVYVNIGDVDMAASREALSYDKNTVELLRNRLTLAMAELEKEITREINHAPTIWQARRKLHDVRCSFKDFNFTATWNGSPINDYVKIGTRSVSCVNEAGEADTMSLPLAIAERIKIKSRSSSRIITKKDRITDIPADGTVIFIADDRGSFPAVRRYLENKGDDLAVILLTDYDQKWLETTGIAEVAIKTSTLPKPVRNYNNGRGGVSCKAKVYEYDSTGLSGNGGSSAAGYWKPAEVDVNEEDGVYVEISYFSYKREGSEETIFPSKIKDVLELLDKIGKGVKVYGIRPADRKLVENADGQWRTLDQHINEVIAELKPEFEPVLIKAFAYDQYANTYNVYKVDPTKWDNITFATDSLFGNFIQNVVEGYLASKREDVRTYAHLCYYIHMSMASLRQSYINDSLEKVLETYPLLAYMDRYSANNSDYVRAVADYVALVEASK